MLLVVLLLLSGSIIFGMKKCIDSKNKEIQRLEIEIEGYKLQIKISGEITKNERILYAKKKKLLEELYAIGNDINKLIDAVQADSSLKLPYPLFMKPLKRRDTRQLDSGQINQVWRYGGELKKPTDSEVEKKLRKIMLWIDGELS